MTRRMFSDEITSTDAFLDMPSSSQLLYFHLGMHADDDGFVASPRMIMRMINASNDDLKLLMSKKFLLPFDNGVCVIKHWRINNYIRKDIYRETKYEREKKMLYIRPNGAYSFNPENALSVPSGHYTIPSVDDTSTLRARDVHLGKVSIGKVSIGKNREDTEPKKRFIKPSIEEVTMYCKERGNSIDPQQFIDHYESNGWKVGGKSSMKDWRASIRTWERNSINKKGKLPANVFTSSETNTIVDALKRKADKNK